MKKLMIFLEGFGLGLILIGGSFENSQAEEKSVMFQRDTLFGGSVIIFQPEREIIKENYIYSEPSPVKPEKVAGEFLLGGAGSVLCGALGASIGYGMGHEDNGGWFDDKGLIGALVGYLVASNLGSATGVYLIGNSGDEKGSYLAALGGSLAGTLVGGAVAVALIRGSEDEGGYIPFILFTAAQSGGATIGFNSSRKKKMDPSEAFLNLNEGKFSLAFPQVNLSQDFKSSSSYEVNLFRANF